MTNKKDDRQTDIFSTTAEAKKVAQQEASAKQEALKEEAPKQEALKEEAPKQEVAAPKEEVAAPKEEVAAPKEEVAAKKLAEEGLRQKWCIPVNRHNLSKILSGGIIAPQNSFTDYKNDAQSFLEGSIILLKGGVSNALMLTEDFVGSSNFLTLVEIDFEELNTKLIHQIPSEKDSNGKSQDNVITYSGAIPSSNIKTIYFQLEEDLQDFQVREFEDVPSDAVNVEVNESLFNQQISYDFFEAVKAVPKNKNSSQYKSIYKKSDAYVGSLAVLNEVMVAEERWFKFFEDTILSNKNKNENLKNMKHFSSVCSDIENKLFCLAYELLVDIDGEKDWYAKEFLDDLDKKIKVIDNSLEDKEIYNVWKKICISVLNHNGEVPALGDDGSKVFRAVMLILLRSTPEDISASKNSSLSSGDEVVAFASFLVGAKMGFQRLSKNLKSKSENYSFYSTLKSEVFNAYFNIKTSQFTKKNVSLETSEYGELGTRFILKINNNALISRENSGPQELAKIQGDAATHTKKIHFDFDRKNNRLTHKYEMPNDRSQRIYIRTKGRTENGEPIIQVISPFLDLDGIKHSTEDKNQFDIISEFVKAKYEIDYKKMSMDFLINHQPISIDFENKFFYVHRSYPLHATQFEFDLMHEIAKVAEKLEIKYNPQGPDKY